MPPQEQADLWMALRDRMKVNWAELTVQEKKAGTHIPPPTSSFNSPVILSALPSHHLALSPTRNTFHGIRCFTLLGTWADSFLYQQHTTSPSAPTAPVPFLPQAKDGESLRTRLSGLEFHYSSSLVSDLLPVDPLLR